MEFLEGVVSSIAEADNEIGGLRLTRLTSATSVGDTTFNVESAIDWDESGICVVGGVRYSYTARTSFTLSGITHVDGGVDAAGARFIHHEDSEVLDLNRNYSALDQVRRAMLTAYAEGDDLNALGRNLGVYRLPFVGDDDLFRSIVQGLAYNPKGTVYGLELALNAMVGEGNYEITEHPELYPCTVFVELLGAASLTVQSAGKAFMQPPQEIHPTSSTELLLTGPVIAVGGVKWKNESHLLDINDLGAKPSTYSVDDGGGSYTPWSHQGAASESTNVTVVSQGSQQFIRFHGTLSDNYYRKTVRLVAGSSTAGTDYMYSAVIHVDDGSGLPSSPTAGLRVSAAGRDIVVGVADGSTPNTMKIGFVDSDTFTYFGTPAQVSLVDGILRRNHEVSIRVVGDTAHLEVNGQITESLLLTAFPSSGNNYIMFGNVNPTPPSTQHDIRFMRVMFYSQCSRDYTIATGIGGVNAANPTRFTSTLGLFVAGDVGKALRTFSSATNAQGGSNAGRWVITSVLDGNNVELATVSQNNGRASSSGARFTALNDTEAFTFPDDLGKKLIITGSTTGNDGGVGGKTYTIDKMYRGDAGGTPGAGIDLESYATVLEEKTNIVELIDDGAASPAALVVEAGMTWHLEPDFVTEVSMQHDIAAMFDLVGTTLTLRQAIPLADWPGRVMDVRFSDVLTAQVLFDEDSENLLLSEVPLLYEFYPFYIADPLGFIRTYLDAITAAGVIPDFIGI